MNLQEFKKLLSQILCDIKGLKETCADCQENITYLYEGDEITNITTIEFTGDVIVTQDGDKITVNVTNNSTVNSDLTIKDEGDIVEEEVTEIDFQGNIVEVTTLEEGKVIVTINETPQMQADWEETDIESPSFIKNKPNLNTLSVEDEGTLVEPNTGSIDFIGPDVFVESLNTGEVTVDVEAPVSDIEVNTLVRLPDGSLFSPGFLQDGLISGGIVTWKQDYVYDVSAATYRINGIFYQSETSEITLSPADLTNDRIDVVVVNTDGQVDVIEGTPSPAPVEPTIDPDFQVRLGIIIVEANTTQPTIVPQDWIYRENIEWTTSVLAGANADFNNTASPFAGTKSIFDAEMESRHVIIFSKGSFVDSTDYKALVLKMKSSPWGRQSSLGLRFYLSGSPVGKRVIIKNGSFGFDSSINNYQHIAISLSDFNLTGNIDQLRIECLSSGESSWIRNLYIDDIQLQDSQVVGEPPVKALIIKDEGVNVSLDANEINFVGSAVNVTQTSPGKVDVTITAPAASNDWTILGNSGTDELINFVGTTDNEPLSIRTNNVRRFSIATGQARIDTFDPTVGSAPGGGFYVNAGNKTNPGLVTYPGANIAISGGHLGEGALSSLEGGYWNIAIGDESGDAITTGHNNTLLGFMAGNALTTASNNVLLGQQVARYSTVPFGTVGIGGFALENNIDGYVNVAVGGEAMRYTVSGNDNVAVGWHALRGNNGQTPLRNVAIGTAAGLRANTENVMIGFNQGGGSGLGSNRNTAIGAVQNGWFGGIQDNASDNTVLGWWAGFEGITGNKNILVGIEAAASGNFGQRVSGESNIVIGNKTGNYTQGSSNNIAIGNYVANPGGIGGNATLNIANLIYGINLYTGTTISATPLATGRLGIRTVNPSTTLHITSEAADTSGLRFQNLTSASPTSTGQPIGVDSNGNVVTVAGGGGGGSYTFENGLTESATVVKLGGAFTTFPTVVGTLGANFQSNTLYDDENAIRYFEDSLEKSHLFSLSTQGPTANEGIKTYGGNVIYDLAGSLQGENYYQIYSNYGTDKLDFLHTLQYSDDKVSTAKQINLYDTAVIGNNRFTHRHRLNESSVEKVDDIYYEDGNANYGEVYDIDEITYSSGPDLINQVNLNREIYLNNFYSGLQGNTNLTDGFFKIYQNNGSSTSEIGTTLDGGGDTHFRFFYDNGTDSLQILNPTTLASGANTRTLPISVNGNYADASGNITVAGGGGSAWELTGNAGTTPGTNFLGTTDNQDLVFQRNSQQIARFYSDRLTIGIGAGNSQYSNFIGVNVGNLATSATYSNFIGWEAGNGATSASASNFIGSSAGSGAVNANNSNFIGSSGAGATNAARSNFIGSETGQNATNASNSNFIGEIAGYDAAGASHSNFFGTYTGWEATNASYSNLFGYNVGRVQGTANNIGSNNIIIGTNISLPNATANAINIGGVLFGINTYSNTSGSPSIVPSSTGKIGIRTVTPQNTLHITSEAANTSGLRFTNLTSASPTSTGQAIGVDANGDVVTIASGGGGVSATNGLTESPTDTVKLGGSLIENTTITGTTYTLTKTFDGTVNGGLNITSATTAGTFNHKLVNIELTGANATSNVTSYGLYVRNGHTGGGNTFNYGIRGHVDAAVYQAAGVYGSASNGTFSFGVYGKNTGGGQGVRGESDFSSGGSFSGLVGIDATGNGTTGIAVNALTYVNNNTFPVGQFIKTPPSGDTTVHSIVKLQSDYGSTPSIGFGASLDFQLQYTGTGDSKSNQVISKWITTPDNTRVSELSVTGNSSGVMYTLMQVQATGVIILTQGLSDYADDTAAATGGIPVNGLYRTGSAIKIRVS